MGAKFTASVVMHLILLCLFVIWHVVFTSLGFASMGQDADVSQENCGKQTHILKYTTMNTIFGAMVLLSYAIFPGGGEGARARAMVITIVHGGLLGWGMLMEMQNATCMSVIENKFNLIYTFHQISVYHNAAFFSFMFLHEIYLGEKVNADLTLIPEVKSEHISSEYEYETAHLDHTGYENPNFAEGLRSLNAAENNSPTLPTTSGIESPNFEEEALRTV